MIFRRVACFLILVLVPWPALAHDAFGDLGPFYRGLLHPMADPAQGLLLAATAVLLARQPVDSVRKAFAVLLVCGLIAAALHLFIALPPLKTQVVGGLVAALGLLALAGFSLPVAMTALLAGGAAAVAGLSGDQIDGLRSGLLAAAGMAIGLPVIVLMLWWFLDVLQDRLGRVAGAVAASWVTAVGVMAAALPAAVA
jgi:hypothetical protein